MQVWVNRYTIKQIIENVYFHIFSNDLFLQLTFADTPLGHKRRKRLDSVVGYTQGCRMSSVWCMRRNAVSAERSQTTRFCV